jgi:hypothetical protein
MSKYAISYDLRKPGGNYHDLIEAIKALGGGWCHTLESLWFVNSNLDAVQIRARLLPHIDTNDGLIVTGLTGEMAWFGIGESQSTWLKSA